jgi:uncharacterized Rossmann fold enzyme
MIKSLVTALVATGLVLSAATAEAAARVGQPAPDFTLTDWDGNERSLSEFAGRTVVLEWTNHECPFVVKHYGADNMPAQQRDATGNEVVWLVVNSSAPGLQGHVDSAKAKSVQGNWGAAHTTYLHDPDGTVGRLYAARTTPHMYVIDGDGVLRYAGAIDSIPSADPADIPGATQFVRQTLSELSAGQEISTPVTQPYGCSVKYRG